MEITAFAKIQLIVKFSSNPLLQLFGGENNGTTQLSPSKNFAKQNFRQTKISPNKFFAKQKFRQIQFSPKINFARENFNRDDFLIFA